MPLTPEVWRNEFRANTVNSGAGGNTQNDSTVVQLTNGNIVVLWTSDTDVGAGSSTGTDIIGQIYDSRGFALGGEFRANGVVTDDQSTFSAAALDNGSFVVAYESESAAFGTSIQATVLDTTDSGSVSIFGTRTIQTGILPAGDQVGGPAVAGSTADGSYVVAYQYLDSSASLTAVNFRHVDSAGLLGPVQNSSGTSSTFNGNTEIAQLSNGNYVVVYQADGADDGIVFRLLSSSGIPGTGGYIAGTNSDLDDDSDPTVIGLANGGFVVAWVDTDADTDVQVQIFNNAGVAQGDHFNVNNGFGVNDNNNQPHLIALADGGFVVAYDDDAANSMRGQRYDANGNAVGAEFIITNSGIERDPSGIGLDDGRFVVGWTTSDGPGSNVEIEIYDPRDNENSPNDYTTDQVIGTVGNDTIDISSADDEVYGWNGNDRFVFEANDINFFSTSDFYDGGSGSDTIEMTGSGLLDLYLTNLRSFNELEFNAVTGQDKTVRVNASQFGTGLSSSALIDGNNTAGSDDTLLIYMGTETSLDLSNLTFQDWQADADNTDRLIVIGDNSAETITGSIMGDAIEGRGGNDAINGDGGEDLIYAGAGEDNIAGGAQNDTLYGGTGNDTLNGQLGRDTLFGEDGDDLLLGGNRNDSLYGGLGNDVLAAGNDDDYADGGNNDDLIRGGDGDDVLRGGNGNDRILGGTNSDEMYGGSGDDRMFGRGGFDTINGGAGNDDLYGGFNADTFIFADGFGVDIIYDFEETNNAEDIDLSGVSSIVNWVDLFNNHLTYGGGNAIIDDGAGNTITLIGVTGGLDVNDFIF